ncbi:hypothetical protein K438DRAFT_1101332 [Mycena galopus ATCC 62051]|nr:hypothetical protein K438DRAFT_1101332 [Mycena galopus ATCC 62051]
MFWRKRNKPGRPDEGERGAGHGLPQELIDECLSYLASQPTDLKACALVCRSWSHPAQRLFFNVISVMWTTPGSTPRNKRLEKTLRGSPHLIPYVHTLALRLGTALDIKAFEKICTFPFTHLENVYIYYFSKLTLRLAIVLRGLLRTPTLQRVDMQCSFMESATFLALWDTCSPSIRHLYLGCCALRPQYVLRPVSPRPYSVELESLRLVSSNNVDEWLKHDLCPFDVSRLAILSINSKISILGWKRMAPALQTIEALDFSCDGKDPVNLSLFPHLLFLRIHQLATGSTATMALDTLSTISSSSRIQQIVLEIKLPTADLCYQLDSNIAGLPMLHFPSIGLEMSINQYHRWAQHFPRLLNLLHCSAGSDWFEVSHEFRAVFLKQLTISLGTDPNPPQGHASVASIAWIEHASRNF